MGKPEHPSNSRVQLEIEKEVVAILSKRDKIDFQTGQIPLGIENVNFNFDFHFFSEDLNIIGEIYAGIEKISAGSRKKVITDCFKMVFAEELLGYKCDKRLIFIDEDVKKTFTGDSWAAKAIEKYKIKPEVIKISEEDLKKLIATKKLQQISNHK